MVKIIFDIFYYYLLIIIKENPNFKKKFRKVIPLSILLVLKNFLKKIYCLHDK